MFDSSDSRERRRGRDYERGSPDYDYDRYRDEPPRKRRNVPLEGPPFWIWVEGLPFSCTKPSLAKFVREHAPSLPEEFHIELLHGSRGMTGQGYIILQDIEQAKELLRAFSGPQGRAKKISGRFLVLRPSEPPREGDDLPLAGQEALRVYEATQAGKPPRTPRGPDEPSICPPALYKTILCKFFMDPTVPKCTRGQACTFAHGTEELSQEESRQRSDEEVGNAAIIKANISKAAGNIGAVAAAAAAARNKGHALGGPGYRPKNEAPPPAASVGAMAARLLAQRALQSAPSAGRPSYAPSSSSNGYPSSTSYAPNASPSAPHSSEAYCPPSSHTPSSSSYSYPSSSSSSSYAPSGPASSSYAYAPPDTHAPSSSSYPASTELSSAPSSYAYPAVAYATPDTTTSYAPSY